MPECQSLLSAFGYKDGISYGDYTITKRKCEHVQIVKYKSYEYYIELHFESRSRSKSQLVSIINKINKNEKVVLSKYHNPYKCKLHQITEKDVSVSGSVSGSVSRYTFIVNIYGKADKIFKH